MSQLSAISSPPASAHPLTAAITGLSMRCSPRVRPPEAEVDDVADAALAADDRRDVGLEVGARAERLVAGAGEDRHVHVVVVAEVGPRLAQRLVRLEIDRVARLAGG